MSDEKKDETKTNEDLVPKAELEKVKTELSQQTESLKKQVDDAKLQLLSPEYLEYLENKVKGKKKEEGGKSESEEIKTLKAEIAQMRQAQETQAAFLELEQVKKEHKDFETHKPAIQKILETSRRDMSIEEAYWIAKGQHEPKPDEKKAGGNERPGGITPPSTVSTKVFKNETEAAYAAANEVLARHNISGDTI